MLSGQIALVTGASRGFGYAAALGFAAMGAHVVALARTSGGLEELDDAIKAAGGQATLVPLDITDDPGLERLGAAIHGRWGRLDLWLHTAAYAPPLQPAEHIDAKELDRVLATNIRAYQRLIRVVDPLLRLAPRGVALIAADDPGAKFHGLYAAAKAAQSALTQAWAAEATRLVVAEVVPPPMPTALRARFHPGEGRDALPPCTEVAARLMAALPQVTPGARLRL